MELYFNLFKIKYEKLIQLLREDEDIYIKHGDTVNIFINLEPIFMKLCNPRVNEKLKTRGKHQFEFIANVINLAAHYRWFFTKNRIKSRVFLYCPSPTNLEYKNSIYNKEYRVHYNFKFTERGGNLLLYEMICESIPFIQLITEYLEDIYFICSNNVENSLVPYIILNHKDEDDDEIEYAANFIVSSSLYDVQYVNKKCDILLPKRDKSVLLSRKNVIPYIMVENECNEGIHIGPKMLPFILSIIGNKNRNIYNIKNMGIKTTFKLLEKALDLKVISNDVTSIHMLLDVIKSQYREELLNNYYCTDLDSQLGQLNVKDRHSIIDQVVNKFDNIALKKINDRYFKYHPLQLIEITQLPGRKEIKF